MHGTQTPAPATPQTARAINDRAALELFAERGALTAGDLQLATGLARPTVAELLARLAEQGLIEQIGETGADRRGPNARLYALDGAAAGVIGLDARRGELIVAVADLAGRLLAHEAVGIPRNLPADQAADRVRALLDRAVAAAGPVRPHTCVLGLPGLVDPVSRQVSSPAADYAWHAGLREAAAAAAGLDPAEVIVENEVNLAALAEYSGLRREGEANFALFWLADGLGAGLVLDGVLRRGASGGAGEIAYLPVPPVFQVPDDEPDPEVPGVGLPGVEASGAELPDPDSRPRMLQLCDVLSGRHVARLAESVGANPGDFTHPAYLRALAERIAVGAGAVAVTVDPGLIVLGGPLGRAGGERLAAAVAEQLARDYVVPARVRPTAVPGNPILTGAVATALSRARTALWPGQ